MPQVPYQLGIDLGTTWSAAAVCRGSEKPEVVSFDGGSASVASVVFLAPDGSLVTGAAAARRALTDPRRVAREFKRRIGDATPLVVGGRPVPAGEIAARFVAWIVAQVAEREGGPASRIAVTHPAEWGPHKRSALADALAEQCLHDVGFLSEPEAAAIGYASTERVEPGGVVGIYDLGGGTFDAAVVRKLVDGGFELLGRPVGISRLGGVDFDEAVFEHVREAIGEAWQELDPADPAVQTAAAGLRRECTVAKEALSADTEVMVPVMLPGIHTQVRLGRAEFEDMIAPAVAETLEALQRAIAGSGVDAGALDAVLLVGGSSRIPLVAQLVSAELGRPVAVDADPKLVIAMGAALHARGPVEPDLATTAALVPDDRAELLDGPPPKPRQELGPVLAAPEPVAPRRYGRSLVRGEPDRVDHCARPRHCRRRPCAGRGRGRLRDRTVDRRPRSGNHRIGLASPHRRGARPGPHCLHRRCGRVAGEPRSRVRRPEPCRERSGRAAVHAAPPGPHRHPAVGRWHPTRRSHRSPDAEPVPLADPQPRNPPPARPDAQPAADQPAAQPDPDQPTPHRPTAEQPDPDPDRPATRLSNR